MSLPSRSFLARVAVAVLWAVWVTVLLAQPPAPVNVQVNAGLASGTCGCSIDAGPAQTVYLRTPDGTLSTDHQLWGHLLSESVSAVTLHWSQTGGPGGATIVAPWDPITTVTFTGTGSYTFQLAATDTQGTSTASVNVTVNPASSQTQFYVNPNDGTPGTPDGSAGHPWRSLFDTDADNATKWSAILTQLASHDVIVYFAARAAAADTALSVTGKQLRIQRLCRTKIVDTNTPPNTSDVNQSFPWCATTDTTQPHILTVDGMSVYTTSDVVPAWVTYSGTNMFTVTNCSGVCVGWDDHLYRDNVRIRGFVTSGNVANIVVNGSDVVLEHINLHDALGNGPGPLFDNSLTNFVCTAIGPFGCTAINGTVACIPFGSKSRVVFRNIQATNTIGEGAYIGGTYAFTNADGCPPPAFNPPVLTDLLVEGITVDHPGQNGEEGDCVDVKGGWENAVIRTITCTNPQGSCEGLLNFQGCFFGDNCNYIIEQNNLSTGSDTAARDNFCDVSTPANHTFGAITFGGPFAGITVRNNVIFGPTIETCGIYLLGQVNAVNNTAYDARSLRIENNTVEGGANRALCLAGPLVSSTLKDVHIRGNAFISNGTGNQIGDSGFVDPATYDSDYNLFVPAASDFTEGSNSITQASNTGIFVNLAGNDFHLANLSPAILKAINLSVPANHTGTRGPWMTTFNVDVAGTARQAAGTNFDIGAYKK